MGLGDKHPFSISGRTIRKGKTKAKKVPKGKIDSEWSDIDLSTDSSISLLGDSKDKTCENTDICEKPGTSKMAPSKEEAYILKLVSAFSDQRLKNVINERTNDMIAKMDERLTANEEKVVSVEKMSNENKAEIDENKIEIHNLQKEIDDLKQKDRERNLIVSGKLDYDINTLNTVDFLNLLLELNLTSEDIDYVVNIGRDESKRMKIVFNSVKAKHEVMKKRGMLKNKDVWFNDDLTQMRSSIAFKARQAMKSKKIHQTWVSDGKILVKFTPDGRIKRITDISQLPNA